MQKRSQKLQSLQDKKKCQKDACIGDEEMDKVRDEIAEKGGSCSRVGADVAEDSLGRRRFG